MGNDRTAFLIGLSAGLLLYSLLNKWRAVDIEDRGDEIGQGVVGLVGNTRLIRIKSLCDITGCEILGKAEVSSVILMSQLLKCDFYVKFLNPGGSVKDRVSLKIIRKAEQDGLLVPHTQSCIFEGTVGSTGISLATIAPAMGYRASIIMPDDVAKEKAQVLEKLGAIVEKVRPVPIVSKQHFVNIARSRAASYGKSSFNKPDIDEPDLVVSSTTTDRYQARGFFADQFENLANFEAHYESTGPEIWRQTRGKIDAFVAGAGTGGTLAGCAKFLKEQKPNLKIALADPQGSGLYNRMKFGVMYSSEEAEGTRRRHQSDTVIEGIGINRITANFAQAEGLIDEAFKVSDAEAVTMSRHLVANDGLFLGSSSAVNLVAACRLARQLPRGSRIVTILCDSGQRHYSRFWNDEHLASIGITVDTDISTVLQPCVSDCDQCCDSQLSNVNSSSPADGVVGKLTHEQFQALHEFWLAFFNLIDGAPREGTSDTKPTANGSTTEASTVKGGDDAKERARLEGETQNARLALQLYGSVAFLEAFWGLIAMDDPDSIMLRFLRARKWNSNAALAMLASCVKWRIEKNVDHVVGMGEEGLSQYRGFIPQCSNGKCFTQGFDRSGRPVVYLNAALHRASDQCTEAMEGFIIYTMETVRLLLVPPADKVTIVFNMEGFTMKNMDWNCLNFLIKCLEAYYPECLNCVIIHDAPWIVNGIWKIVAPLLDPVVRAKVQFTKKPQDLFVHIPETHLVPELGGETTWKWTYTEVEEGENALQKDERRESMRERRRKLVAEYENISRSWSSSKADPKSDLTRARECLAKALRANYFLTDPFIRGRTTYDRVGTIAGNGLVEFMYPIKSEKAEWDSRGYETSLEKLQDEVSAQVSSGRLSNQTKEVLRDVLCAERGLLADVTSRAVAKHLESQPRVVYLGIDPSAKSLHVGNLVALMALLHFQLAGHTAIALVGGATGSVGDPSGRSSERNALDADVLGGNIDSISTQMKGVLHRGFKLAQERTKSPQASQSQLLVRNNADWLHQVSLLDFLNGPGRRVRVSKMLTRESIKSRLESASGISFQEFTYNLLQAYDFLHLFRTERCTIQLGGSDQYGNIMAGIEMIQKASIEGSESSEAFGITLPLLTTSSGAKFGKSAGNAIWLSSEQTSALELYQFFLQTPDDAVSNYLKIFTFLPLECIEDNIKEHDAAPHERKAQRLLASEVVELVHGKQARERAVLASKILYGSILQDCSAQELLDAMDPSSVRVLPHASIIGATIESVISAIGWLPSQKQIRQMITSGSFSLNGKQLTKLHHVIEEEDLWDKQVLLFKSGKRVAIIRLGEGK